MPVQQKEQHDNIINIFLFDDKLFNLLKAGFK